MLDLNPGTGISNPVPSSGESANFRSLSRWRASNTPAPRLFAGVKIIAFHRRDATGARSRIVAHAGSACRFFARGELSARMGDHPRKRQVDPCEVTPGGISRNLI